MSEEGVGAIAISVKHGGSDVELAGLGAATTVAAVKELLEERTGVFARHQKLIFKGKVLEDKATLAGSKVAAGAKLMLLVSAAQGPKPSGRVAPGSGPSSSGSGLGSRPRQPPAPQQRPHAAPAGAGRGTGAGTGGGSSSGGAPGGDATLGSLAERRSAWSKTGVVALRDLGLALVPEGAFDGLPAARTADLSQNRLEALPPSVSQLASLASLRLADNRLTDGGVPWDALASLRGLTLLALDGNALTRLPAALGGCGALVRLSAARNSISEVEGGALARLGALRELELSDNRLAALPEDIGTCSSLQDLSAARNQLAAIPASITRLGALQNLRLDDNRVKRLPEGLFTGCTALAALLLRSNPVTVEALRSAPGFGEYEARRRARTDKQLGGRVLADIERAFCEGADVAQWEHHK